MAHSTAHSMAHMPHMAQSMAHMAHMRSLAFQSLLYLTSAPQRLSLIAHLTVAGKETSSASRRSPSSVPRQHGLQQPCVHHPCHSCIHAANAMHARSSPACSVWKLRTWPCHEDMQEPHNMPARACGSITCCNSLQLRGAPLKPRSTSDSELTSGAGLCPPLHRGSS